MNKSTERAIDILIDTTEHDKQIRAEAIDECKKTIQKMFEYIDSEGLPHYALYAYLDLTSVSNALEQLKEQNKEVSE